MSDNQLKIRIRLDQSANNPATEQNPPPLQEGPVHPPSPLVYKYYEYYWPRIIGASLVLLLVLALLLWLAFDWNTHDDTDITALSVNLPSIMDNPSVIQEQPTLSATPSILLPDQPSENDWVSNESTNNTPTLSEHVQDLDAPSTTPDPTPGNTTDLPIKPEVKPKIPSYQLKKNNTQISYPAGLIKAQLTSNIHQRTPVDTINSISLAGQPSRSIFLFLHFNQFKDKRIFVNWYYHDKRVARVALPIGTKDWRTYSSKILNQHHLGPWHVTATNSIGKLLVKFNFRVTR